MASLYKSSETGPSEGYGIIIGLAALAECLDKNGLLSFEEYRDKLMSLASEIPANDISRAAAAFHLLIEKLTEALDRRPKLAGDEAGT